jgi:uncharacterized protein YbcI
MRTQGEIEAAVCDGMTRFEQEFMGRGPKDIRAHLIDDILFVRLKGVLTAAEQHLVKSLPPAKGRDLLKDVRTHLLETARPLMEAMVKEVTEFAVVSMHHDISTITGEECRPHGNPAPLPYSQAQHASPPSISCNDTRNRWMVRVPRPAPGIRTATG